MDFKEFTAGPDDEDRRLDRVIRKITDKENLSGLYKAIRKGLIKVNDKKIDSSSHIHNGDVIKIASFLLNDNDNSKNEDIKSTTELNIIFENEDLLIINKPYDVTVQGFDNSLNKIVERYYKSHAASKESLSFTPGPLHRLDKKTTGLLVFSMSLRGARWFSENISNHNIQKKYWGIIQGNLKKEEKWIDFLEKDFSAEKTFQTVSVASEKNNNAKEAVTIATPLKYLKIQNIPCTLVQFDIKTGKTHQIRKQSSFHGYPLLGDTAYGGKKIYSKQDFFLHARELLLPDDRLNCLPDRFQSELPEAFAEIINLNSGNVK